MNRIDGKWYNVRRKEGVIMPRKKSGLFDQREYVNRYHRESIVRKNVTFNKGKPEDMELLAWAVNHPEGFVAYVKRLIRQDMNPV